MEEPRVDERQAQEEREGEREGRPGGDPAGRRGRLRGEGRLGRRRRGPLGCVGVHHAGVPRRSARGAGAPAR